jgi:hypothetical protein
MTLQDAQSAVEPGDPVLRERQAWQRMTDTSSRFLAVNSRAQQYFRRSFFRQEPGIPLMQS